LTFDESPDVIERFQNSFGQMLKQLTNSLQTVKLKLEVSDDDLKSFNFAKLFQQCKKLRKLHIDIILDLLSDADDDCIENELPKHVESIFQDFTDVKIQFYLDSIPRSQQLTTITKKPHQPKAISTWNPKYQI